jgi:hypothetical protein
MKVSTHVPLFWPDLSEAGMGRGQPKHCMAALYHQTSPTAHDDKSKKIVFNAIPNSHNRWPVQTM